VLPSTAAFPTGAGFLVVLVLLDVCGSRLVLARGWHGPRRPMRTVGTPLPGQSKSTGIVCLPIA
jgi:hypothetical protein